MIRGLAVRSLRINAGFFDSGTSPEDCTTTAAEVGSSNRDALPLDTHSLSVVRPVCNDSILSGEHMTLFLYLEGEDKPSRF